MNTLGKFLAVGTLALIFFSCQEIDNQRDELVPELLSFQPAEINPIENQYIVGLYEEGLELRLLSDNVEANQASLRKEVSGLLKSYRLQMEDVLYLYSESFPGFTARMTAEQAAALAKNPKVKFVEQDREGILWLHSGEPNFQVQASQSSTQTVPWGIRRIGGHTCYEGNRHVFVVDTGIQIDHPDLNVKVSMGFDAYQKEGEKCSVDDEHGHGTHVAGIIGALDNDFGVVGVAAGVPLVPVKIFFGPNAAFTYSGMIAGVEYVGQKACEGDVANLSFGGFDASTALDEAVLGVSEKKKVWMVISSGNSRLPATSFSPARVNGKYTITVSAYDALDRFAWFSHYGQPIKFAGPGVGILSTWRSGQYRYETGTSMAAPHISGLRVLGEIGSDGYVLNYPLVKSDPIAVKLVSK